MLDKIERDSDRVDFEGRGRSCRCTPRRTRPRARSRTAARCRPRGRGQRRRDRADPLRQLGPRADGPADQAGQEEPGRVRGRAVDRTKRLAKGFRKKINRQIFGDGIGTLATLATSPAAATTFTVDSTQYLKVGQIIDVRTKTTARSRTPATCR
jgi:hypothetical protein